MPVDSTALLLGALALALAWPVPLLLARAKWPAAAPVLALGLWQSIALAGGISMIGSLLLAGLEPFGDDLWSRIGNAAAHLFQGPLPAGVTLLHTFALSAAVLLAAHLVLNLALTSVRSRRQRQDAPGACCCLCTVVLRVHPLRRRCLATCRAGQGGALPVTAAEFCGPRLRHARRAAAARRAGRARAHAPAQPCAAYCVPCVVHRAAGRSIAQQHYLRLSALTTSAQHFVHARARPNAARRRLQAAQDQHQWR